MSDEKHKRLNELLALKKITSPPDYYMRREISALKRELGLSGPKPNPKRVKSSAKKEKEIKEIASRLKRLTYLEGLRVAVDVAVSERTLTLLREMGFNVVVQAEHSEPDSEWMARAIDGNVEVVVSDDLQVQWHARNYGIVAVQSWARNDHNGERLYAAIVAAMDEELDLMP